jgi:beta-galactosidase
MSTQRQKHHAFRWAEPTSRLIRIAASSLALATVAVAAPVRSEHSLNQSWRFHFGDVPDARKMAAEPADWPVVNLPHTWNARDGADGGNDYAKGIGWYVRRFTIDPSWTGRQIFLQFDGANRRTEVFLNGKRIGEHRGGFARFRFDVTDAIDATKENMLAVSVSNALDGTPPISADFTFFGGLYRGVKLFATNLVHVDALDFGADGFYLTQENVGADRAELSARVKLRNDGAAPATALVHVELRTATGETVASSEDTVTMAAAGAAVSDRKFSIERPHLWAGRKDPYLYTAVVSLRVNGEWRDEISQRIGLRSFRIDPDHGFFLNGGYLDLHGVSRHQDRADKGWAIGPAENREDFEFVKEIGATAIRMAHYPQSDLWCDLADENGMVVWAEIPVVNEVPDTALYADNAAEQLRELIRQHYNHPSICFWGVGNETREIGDVPGHETVNAPRARALIATLNDVVHAEDQTRLSTYASHHRDMDERNFLTDVVGFNKYPGWYGGQPEDLGKSLDRLHERYPKLRLAVSEYGAGANTRQHDASPTPPTPTGPWHPEEYQAILHERQWQALATRPYVWGKFIWNLFDFASDSRAEGRQFGLNDKGLVTYDRRTRKDAFFWYQANWSSEPVLHITSRRWIERETRPVEIKVYSNAPQVEVFLNDVSCGAMSARDHIFLWHETLATGENHIVARARFGARELTDDCTWKLIEHTAP